MPDLLSTVRARGKTPVHQVRLVAPTSRRRPCSPNPDILHMVGGGAVVSSPARAPVSNKGVHRGLYVGGGQELQEARMEVRLLRPLVLLV